MKAWLSMMPVDGEYTPANASTSGSRANTSSRVSQGRSPTPLIRACRR